MSFNKNIIFIICYTVSILLLFTTCKKQEEYSDNSYFGSKVMILGHRGMGQLYKKPGNTYEAIAPAIGIGVDGCEIDIQLTKDTVLVLFHDLTLNPNTTCTGRVYESDWSDIKQCKYYALENMIFINSVDELFCKIPNLNDLYFSFDCKIDENVTDYDLYRKQFLRAIKRLCDKYNMSEHVFIEGDESFLNMAKSLGMSNKLFFFSYLDNNAIDIANNNNFFGISTSLEWLKVNAELAHDKGLYLMVWAPKNDAENKEALSKKADIIQTDDPMSILKLLKRFNYEYRIP
jgi:glycerophosphoryl diester phosphodiesterase